jgi:O-antigen/teichoic acid export membrane protein
MLEDPLQMTEMMPAFDVPRGTAYITYQQVAVYATSVVYYVLLIRVLNLSQIGEVSLLGAAMSVFTTLTQLSLPAAATRFISAEVGGRNPSVAAGVASTTLRLTLAVAGPGLLFALLASPWIGATVFKAPDSTILLLVTFVTSFVLDLTTLYGAYFLGLGRYAEMVYQNVLYTPLSRGIGIALAYEGLGPLGIVLGWALGALITLLFSLYLWKGKLSVSGRYPARPLLIFSLPLFAAALITLAQGWGDITLLQALLGQFGTTGAYYLVVSSVAFLSILWSPAAGALYPALSSAYVSDGPRALSNKLGVATRLVNLTVIPTGATLAAVAPTALGAVYGSALGNQAIPFAILAATIIFSAQSLLLITTLQSVGRTAYVLGISLTAVLIDFAAVGLGATALGTTAGAIGRAVLALVTTALAWWSLRDIVRVPLTNGLSKAVILAIVSAVPLVFVDNFLTLNFLVVPLFRVPVLSGVFAICFLAASRILSAFTADDFDLLENALPRLLHGPLRVLELLVTRERTDTPIIDF